MTPERLAKIRALVARGADIGKGMSADLLAAIEAHGLAIVPVEATLQQINDAMEGDSNPQDVYRAMIEAGKL